MPIHIVKQSILDCSVEAIVNPANNHLHHGGGLARIIEQEATKDTAAHMKHVEDAMAHDDRIEQWFEDHEAAPLIATGNCHTTSAGMLPFKYVIHTVGPIWNGGRFWEDWLLYSAHATVLQEAARLKLQSIAFPAISCGIFGYPVRKAAPVAAKATRVTLKNLNRESMDVYFALMEDSHLDAYGEAFS